MFRVEKPTTCRYERFRSIVLTVTSPLLEILEGVSTARKLLPACLTVTCWENTCSYLVFL